MEKMTSSRWFNIASWGITAVIVAGLLGFAFWRMQQPTTAAAAPAGTEIASEDPQAGEAVNISWLHQPAIERRLTLKTIIPERPRYAILDHTVQRGDSIFRISKEFGIKPETLLWANYAELEDDPHSLKPGQELSVPPTDGIIYEWKDGDSIDKIAAEYEANPDDILNWQGNDIDLTNPKIEPGQWVMIPGGWRESKAITLPTIARGSGTGSANVGGSACGAGGAVGGGFVWPADNHSISGNDYYPGHLGIDISDGEGGAVYAASSGVVTIASNGWNGGYGNVIMIDHGNGYVTVYAHLSQINVSACQSVNAGNLIGLAGNTGNSSGAHLHFEVRQGGGNISPWFVLP